MSFVDDTMRRIADPDQWEGLDADGLLRLLFDGQLLYGATNDASMVRHLFPLYLEAMERRDAAARAECYRALEQEVEKRPCVSQRVPLPRPSCATSIRACFEPRAGWTS